MQGLNSKIVIYVVVYLTYNEFVIRINVAEAKSRLSAYVDQA